MAVHGQSRAGLRVLRHPLPRQRVLPGVDGAVATGHQRILRRRVFTSGQRSKPSRMPHSPGAW